MGIARAIMADCA